jgi:hypothetical protein
MQGKHPMAQDLSLAEEIVNLMMTNTEKLSHSAEELHSANFSLQIDLAKAMYPNCPLHHYIASDYRHEYGMSVYNIKPESVI